MLMGPEQYSYASTDLNLCSMAGFPEILRIAEKIRLPEILEKHLSTKYEKEIKNSDLIMSVVGVRICNPSSILSSIETIKQSTIPTILGMDVKKIKEDLFYKRFKNIEREAIARVQQEVFDSVKEKYNTDLSIIDWDTSFIYVEGRKNELGSKGVNTTNKSKPYGVKTALIQSRGKIPIPLFYRVMTGKTADVTMLREDRERIKQFVGSLLVLDRFTKSDEDIADFKKDGVDVLTGERITEKIAEEIRQLNYKTIKVDGIKMRHALSTRVVKVKDEEITIWRHIFFDPVKAERDKKRREKKNKKVRKKQEKAKKLVDSGKLDLHLLKKLNKILKNNGIKAEINLNIEDVEYEEIQDDPSMDGLMVLSTTRKMKPAKVFKTYRQHLWIEKGIKELKQFHMLRPLFVRNDKMVDMLMLVSFLSYLLTCLFRIEHKPFENSNDGTIASLLNAPCVLLEMGKKFLLLLSERIAKFFGKFIDIWPKKLKLNELLKKNIGFIT